MTKKICTGCKEEKPVNSEFFPKDKTKTDGFAPRCKSCKSEYYFKNVIELSTTSKEHYQLNKGCIKSKAKKYRQDNKAKLLSPEERLT